MEIAVPHAHTATLEAARDLINSLELDGRDGLPDDHLPTADDAVAFLAGRGLAHEADLRRQLRREGEDAWLARVRDVRGALRQVWESQVDRQAPDATALATVNALLDLAPRRELRAAPEGLTVDHRHRDDDPTGEALERAAAPLLEAIATGRTDRFRVCDNDACRWVFEDASRAGRRRWCDMATCGNRAKVRRFRSRRREDATGDPDEAE